MSGQILDSDGVLSLWGRSSEDPSVSMLREVSWVSVLVTLDGFVSTDSPPVVCAVVINARQEEASEETIQTIQSMDIDRRGGEGSRSTLK